MKFEKPNITVPEVAYTAQELAIDIGCNILAARVKKGITQTKLAEMIGSRQPAIARVERGNTLPSFDFLLRISKALGIGLVAPRFGIKNKKLTYFLYSNTPTITSTYSSS